MANGLGYRDFVSDVANDEFDVLTVSRIYSTVERYDIHAIVQQSVDDMSPDESGCTGHKHCRSSHA
jgi:hypothetical protein